MKLIDSPWPRNIILFFIALAIVESGILYIAITTHAGLIEERPYQQGIAYQEKIDALERTQAQQWQFRINTNALAQQAPLSVEIVDAQQRVVSGATVRFSATRPAAADLDTAGTLAEHPTSHGRYVSTALLNAPGLWLLTFDIQHNGVQYLHRQRVHIPTTRRE